MSATYEENKARCATKVRLIDMFGPEFEALKLKYCGAGPNKWNKAADELWRNHRYLALAIYRQELQYVRSAA